MRILLTTQIKPMFNEFSDTRHNLFKLFIILSCVGIFAFTLFQFRRVIEGPDIVTINVEDGQVIHDATYILEAQIHNAAFIYLNGRPVYTNKESLLRERIVLFEGYNLIELRVNDKFDRQQVKTYRLVYIPASDATL